MAIEGLYKAVREGDFDKTREILNSRPEACNMIITDKNETALHIAVAIRREDIVKELVDHMLVESLKICDSIGHTALIRAVVHGNRPMVDCMLEKSPDLISIKSSRGNNLPIVMAIDFGQIEMTHHLFKVKDSIPDLEIQDHNGATLLTCAIYAGTLDIAWELIQQRPRLALAIDKFGESGILALASVRRSFPSGRQLGFWKQRIYSCMCIPLAPAINVQAGQSNRQEINRSSGICTQLCEMQEIHDQYYDKLLSKMREEISESESQQLEAGLVYDAISRAAENGMFEFVSEMLGTDRRFIWTEDKNRRNIFMLAVLHRQEKIFNILYQQDTTMNYCLTCLDLYENNMLHMAGMMKEEYATRINQISGAALQMQRELQWFKEVETIVLPKYKESKNKGGLTPRQLFTKDHKDMKEKGEKWMKNTATSCTVVGTLIVTIMFAAVFSFRDDNQGMGLPKSLNKFLFNIFIISDALSLFSSSTSVLMFLGILTSRYSEEDFLEYLPRQMIIGLLTLFCSIASMMITFSSALLIILHEQLWIAIPLICLAIVPVTLFVWIQFPILKDMIISTYGPSIFDRKMKS
ncbi:hypothetical protein F2P56_033417 [Juglans regia]|uniref:Uncharacterized protein LOC108999053 n=2 Tax=Juglans regia TaxID=51240 RepID=A0A2I4FIC2_JUGRE|nr:uncharacterized protein LOC108999053 [Juglans regia]XP_035541440.1 uncharacterized protein LOC108999053 [Juglans regia]KAF5447901.1 hypothetical protein F2P56_033417 [Juglans regia]